MAVYALVHAAVYADMVLGKDGDGEVVRHEVVAGAETVAGEAAAEGVVSAVVPVFQAAHVGVGEGLDEGVEVFVCEAEEHGGGELFEVFDDLEVEFLGEVGERGRHFFLPLMFA